VSSIADKFKKFLPQGGNSVSVGSDSAATLSLDSIETVQTGEDRVEHLRRDAVPGPEMPTVADAELAAVQSTEAEPPAGDAGAVPPPVVRSRRSQRASPARQQRILALALAGVVLLLLLVAGSAILRAERLAQQVAATGQSLMQSQRLAKSVSQALVGNVAAFAEVRDSADDLTRRVQGLSNGDDSLKLERVGSQYDSELGKITPLVERADKSAKAVLAQQKILTQVGTALRDINRQSSDLLEMAETVASLKMQQSATIPEISAAGQLVMLTQRIGKSANEFLTVEGVSPDAVFLLGKDLNSFQEITRGLLDGSPQQGLVAAREAQAAILADSEPLRTSLGDLQDKLSARTGLGAGTVVMLFVLSLAALALAGAIGFVQVREGRERAAAAERDRVEAERVSEDASRVNAANQAAILRLMNELQTVAEGDLTQEATV